VLAIARWSAGGTSAQSTGFNSSGVGVSWGVSFSRDNVGATGNSNEFYGPQTLSTYDQPSAIGPIINSVVTLTPSLMNGVVANDYFRVSITRQPTGGPQNTGPQNRARLMSLTLLDAKL